MIKVRYVMEGDDFFQFVLREGTADDIIFEWRNDEYSQYISVFTYGGGQISEWDDYEIPDQLAMERILYLIFEKEIG